MNAFFQTGFWRWFKSVMKCLYLYLIGIASVFLVGFVLMYTQQGIDVMVQVGEHPGPFIFTFLSEFFWVFLIWYSSRVNSYAKSNRDPSIPKMLHRHFPRVIALLGLVFVQVSIFSLPSQSFTLVENTQVTAFFFFKNGWEWLFICAHFILYAALVVILEMENKPRRMRIYYVTAVVLVLVYLWWIGYAWWKHREVLEFKRHVTWLPLFALLTFLTEIATIVFFIQRRKKIDDKKESSASVQWTGSLGKAAIDPKYKQGEQETWRLYFLIVPLSLMFYAWATAGFDNADRMGPLAVLLLSLGVLAYLVNVVSYYSMKVQVNLHVILFTWAFLIGLLINPYKVKTLPVPNDKPAFANRPTVRDHLFSWLHEARRSRLLAQTKDTFEVYIVLSNGGGALSGNWVSSVLTRLQDRSVREDSTNTFADHLLGIAGASGGTIGNVAFYSLLKERLVEKNKRMHDSLSQHAADFFRTDFLSYTLAHMLGTDIYRHILPVGMVLDRAQALEYSMTHGNCDTMVARLLNKPLQDVYDHTGVMPVLFINTTRVDNGMPWELSSVTINGWSQREDVNRLLDSVNTDYCFGSVSIRFASAGVLSSRFPYVSPAGMIKGAYFVDGGYFDNSGAGIVLEYIQELERIRKDSTITDPQFKNDLKKIHFNVIQISNGITYESKKRNRIHPLTNDLASPLLTLAGTQGASTKIGDGALIGFLRGLNPGISDTSYYTKLNLFYEKEEESTFPMSWDISDYNLARMKQRADEIVRNKYFRISLKLK